MNSFYHAMYSSFYLSFLYTSILSSPLVINTIEFMLLHLLIPSLNVYHYLIGDNTKLKLIYYKNTLVFPSDNEDESENGEDGEDEELSQTSQTSDDDEEDNDDEDDENDEDDDTTINSNNVEGDLPKLLSARNNLIMFSSLLNSEITGTRKTDTTTVEPESTPVEAESAPVEPESTPVEAESAPLETESAPNTTDVYIPSTPPPLDLNQDNILDDVLSNLEIKNLVEKVNNLV